MLWENRVHLPLIQIGALVIVAVTQLVAKQTEIASLPHPVVAAVEARFPGASWRGVKTEDEDGQAVHEVRLQHKGAFLSVTVTPAGELVEVEREIFRTDLPRAARDALGRKRLDAITSVEEVCRGGAVVGYEVRHADAWWGNAKVNFDTASNIVSEARR